MIHLADVLKRQRIDLHIKASHSREAIAHLAGMLRHDGDVKNWAGFYDALLGQGERLNICLEEGLAIPHVRSDHVSSMVIVAGRSKEGVQFPGAPTPIPFVFLIGTPVAMASDYLRLIGALARVFKNPKTVRALAEAASEEEFISILSARELAL